MLRGIVQFDTLNEVNIRLSDGTKAFNYDGYTNIIFKVLKADGTAYIDSEGENVIATSPVDGVVTVNLAGQSTTAAGLCQSVLEIYSGDGKMTTARFNYEVFENLDTNEAVESTTEYPALQNLLTDLSGIKADAAVASGYVARAEKAAETAEMWGKAAQNVADGDFATRAELEAVEAGAAPAGYGLGGDSVLPPDNDLNKAISNGFYYTTPTTLNRIYGYDSVVVSRKGNYVEQVSFSYVNNQNCLVVQRASLDGGATWMPWEHLNPQMYLDNEYRTTERYNGRPVYAKRFNAGLFPSAGSVKEIDFTTGTESEGKIGNIVSVSGIAGTWTIPTDLYGGVITNDGKVYLTARVTSGNGVIYIGTASRDLTAVSAHVIVKYTKTTDT